MVACTYQICQDLKGSEMDIKKITAICLLACFNFVYVVPAFAITDNSKKQNQVYTHKVKKGKKETDDYKYAYVNMDFWKQFNDDNLNHYIALAIKQNYDLKIASLTVKQYYQNMKLQFAKELPTAGIGIAPAWFNAPMVKDNFAVNVPAAFNYEVDIFLKNRDKTKAIKELYKASQDDERAAYISVASAVGYVYFNIVKLNEAIKIQEQIVASRLDIYNMMLASNKEGLVSTSDTVKANKSYIAGLSDLIDLKKNRAKLLDQFCVLIGENPNEGENLVFTPLNDINFSGIIPEEITSDIITSRPDYLKAEKMIKKAGIDVRVAKKEFLPSINLTGIALLDATHSMFSKETTIAALAAGAMLPVFTGGARIANLKLKKVQYDKMLENYYKTNLTAIKEVNDALATVKYDKDKLNEHIKQFELESKDFGYTQNKYNQGVISRLDLVQLQENLLNVEKLINFTRSDCYISYIELYKAVGSKL